MDLIREGGTEEGERGGKGGGIIQADKQQQVYSHISYTR